ncbi:EthD family reductase [Marinivivus vitaminiproducens]|uniref:EthD family reductase n=1 Tax=Marinivivus vitaminiproducens TaxID=3035935 RepID=UPI0027A2BA31|nr:EthD family reductase [Geminicoccaceae bacterium SCSIO 64248]
MTTASVPVQIYVTYQGAASDRFDRDLYVNRHLPLVMSLWGKYGLQSVRALFPAGDADGTVAVCECLFRDEVAMEAAFSSAETPEVMADVALFTDLTPNRFRAVPLKSN